MAPTFLLPGPKWFGLLGLREEICHKYFIPGQIAVKYFILLGLGRLMGKGLRAAFAGAQPL